MFENSRIKDIALEAACLLGWAGFVLLLWIATP